MKANVSILMFLNHLIPIICNIFPFPVSKEKINQYEKVFFSSSGNSFSGF